MSLYTLGAVTYAGYQARTGDSSSAASAVSGALEEAESLLEEELRRLLPSEPRTEVMRIHADGRVYPKAWPITTCTTNPIDGRALLGALPDINQYIALIGVREPLTATIDYTGGWTAATLPVTLAHAIYDLARALVIDVAPLLVGATSMSVGDVSVSYASAGGAGGLDAYVPGLSRRVARYKNRFQ